MTVRLALALVSAAAPVAAQDAGRAVRQAELARFAAQTARDTAALRRLLGNDLVYVHSNGVVESKARFIEAVATGSMVYDSVIPLQLDHRVFGETAVGNGKARVQVRTGGQTHRVELLFTTVHVRRDGQWRLVAWQSTRAP